MRSALPVAAVLIAGACLAMQAPTNASLARTSGSVLFAAFMSFAVGAVVLLCLWLGLGQAAGARPAGASAWMWLGGLYGAIYVVAMAYAAPRLGMAGALTTALCGQVLAALFIDQFALFGLAARPMSGARLSGAVLVLAGVLLSRR